MKIFNLKKIILTLFCWNLLSMQFCCFADNAIYFKPNQNPNSNTKTFKQVKEIQGIVQEPSKITPYDNSKKFINNSKFLIMNQELLNNFSYEELVELSKAKHPHGYLEEKLRYTLNNPIVDSSISTEDVSLQENDKIGKFIRLASWNIDRGFNLDSIKMIFDEPDKLASQLAVELATPPKSSHHKFKPKTQKQLQEDIATVEKVKEQMAILKKSNIFVLTEVDNGMPRTNYKCVVQELAKTLKYNYAYGIEFMEVDPVHLGLEDYKWSEEKTLSKKITIDMTKYRGEHGTAILSQFPITNARMIRLPESYDWFYSEKERLSELENLKRVAAKSVFNEDMIREIRQGSRMALIADVKVPGLDTPVTVVAVHLENRAIPKRRAEQMKFLLKNLYNINNPVIIAGDFNTSTSDGSPTSFKKEVSKTIGDPNFLAKTLLLYTLEPHIALATGFVPSLFTTNSILGSSSIIRKASDPTVKNIPVVSPNQESGLFKTIHNFKFQDGYTFDFRGDKDKSSRNTGTLSDSNERKTKGFTPTYLLDKHFIFGKYKLDWIFVKAYAKKPNDKQASNKLAPHFGRTLYNMNFDFDEPFSDHAPVTVDLPIQDSNNVTSTTKNK